MHLQIKMSLVSRFFNKRFNKCEIMAYEYEWKNKILLITGASKGIGANIVRQALNEGVQQVYNLDIDVQNGILLQNEINEKYNRDVVNFIECDVTNEEQLKSKFEGVLTEKTNEYVVINNAGLFNETLHKFRKQIEINLIGLVTGSLIALDLMRKDNGGNGGTMINISSVAALRPSPYTPIYNATKSAVLTFSMGLGANDYYNRSGVRVLTMCYGLTDTELVAKENRGSFDKEMEDRLIEPLAKYPYQRAESAARGIIEMYKLGKSASVWLANADLPAEDITDAVTKAYGIMSEPVFK